MPVLLSTLLLLFSSEQPQGRSADSRCEVAAEVIENLILAREKSGKRKIVFRQDRGFNYRIADAKQTGEVTADLPNFPPELFPRLEATGDLNAVAECPEVRVALDRKQVRYDQRSVDRSSRHKRNLESRAIVYSTSLPVLSDDGKVALFLVTMNCGGRCGSGDLVRAERSEGGQWRIAQEYFLFVS